MLCDGSKLSIWLIASIFVKVTLTLDIVLLKEAPTLLGTYLKHVTAKIHENIFCTLF